MNQQQFKNAIKQITVSRWVKANLEDVVNSLYVNRKIIYTSVGLLSELDNVDSTEAFNLYLKEIDKNKSITQEAMELIEGKRKEEYGDALTNFTNIAAIWSVILSSPVSPQQVAMCMMGLKMARLKHTPHHRDSKVDLIGYALLMGELK